MNLQDAIIIVVEEWRKRRGLTQIEIGLAVFPESAEPRVAGDKWSHVVKGRKETGKKRQLSVDELDALADFFGVNPETIIIEARHRLGKNSGRSEIKSKSAG